MGDRELARDWCLAEREWVVSMDYIIDREGIMELPEAFSENNPAMPFPDCVSLKVVIKKPNAGGKSEVQAHLRFGAHQLNAVHQNKSFAFSVSLRKAKLRLLAVEGLKIDPLSVLGTARKKNATKLATSLSQENKLSTEAMGKISAAISGARTPLDIIRAAVSLGLHKDDQSVLITKMQSANEFEEIDVGFDGIGPFWHLVPNFDIPASFLNGTPTREKTLSGDAISFGRGRVFSVVPTQPGGAARLEDTCLLFGVSANIRDISIDIHDDTDNEWWREILAKRGFREKKEVAQVAVRNILSRRIQRDLSDGEDGNLIFVLAAAEPAID
jgi:hypothetical protein